MAANTTYPPSSSSAATTPTSPVAFAHQQQQQIFVSPSNRRQSVRPGPRTDAATVPATAPGAPGTNGIGGSPSSSSPNILDPPPGLPYAEFVAQWHDPHIARWLTDNKCAQYIQAFRDNDIRGDIILELDMDTLKEIGLVSVGDRTRIRNAIKLLRQRCQRPSTRPTLLLNGSPNDLKFSSAPGLKLNGDATTTTTTTHNPTESYPTVARGHRRLESVRPPPLQIENVRSRDLPRLERGSGSNSQGPDSARVLTTPRVAQPPPLGATPRVTTAHAIPNIPPAPKGPPPMPPGGSKNTPRLQVPPSALRGARTPTQDSTPPPPWTSDPLPPQPPPPVSPWTKEYGLPRSITPGNIAGGSFAARTTPPNPRGVRSPVMAHQKQPSFGSAPRPAGRLGAGVATTAHPYAANAAMGIVAHNILTPVQENFPSASTAASSGANSGYSVGRGPFPQRGQSASSTMTTSSDDFRRKTLKFHLRDSGSRMIEVKEFDGGSEILERALKKFNVRVNAGDSEYAHADGADGLHVDGWAVYLGPETDRASLFLKFYFFLPLSRLSKTDAQPCLVREQNHRTRYPKASSSRSSTRIRGTPPARTSTCAVCTRPHRRPRRRTARRRDSRRARQRSNTTPRPSTPYRRRIGRRRRR